MSEVTYCTILDKNSMARGLAMLESLHKHDASAKIIVLCLDKIAQLLLTKICPFISEYLPLDAFEKDILDLKKAKSNRAWKEFKRTLIPVFILHTLEKQEEGARVIYIDPEVFFFSSLRPIIREGQHNSITMLPNNFPKRLKHLHGCGNYNTGIFSVKKEDSALSSIKWWAARCLEACPPCSEGIIGYGEQVYLDPLFHNRVNVGEFKHPGIGIGPWNQENDILSIDENENVFFGKVPLVSYNFHSLIVADMDIVVASSNNIVYRLSTEVMRCCYAPYLTALDKAFSRLRSLDPNFNFGMDSTTLDINSPLMIRTSQVEKLCTGIPGTRHNFAGGFTFIEPNIQDVPPHVHTHPKWKKVIRNSDACLIMANGPSLNSILQEIIENKKYFDIHTLNASFMHDSFKSLAPAVHIWADPLIFEILDGTSDDPFGPRERWGNFLESITWPMTLAVPHQFYDSIKKHIHNPHIHLTGFPTNKSTNLSSAQYQFLEKGHVGFGAQNVVIGALYIALMSGYKKIWLAGADASWLQNLKADEHCRLILNDIHFYDSPHVYLPTTYLEQLHSITKYLSELEQVQQYATSVNVEIINLSMDSMIDTFAKGTLAGEIFENKRASSDSEVPPHLINAKSHPKD